MRPQAVKVPEAYRGLARKARKAGWVITWSQNHHLRWQAPDGTVIYTAGTPSRSSGYLNKRAEFRRAGLAA